MAMPIPESPASATSSSTLAGASTSWSGHLTSGLALHTGKTANESCEMGCGMALCASHTWSPCARAMNRYWFSVSIDMNQGNDQ